MSRTLWTLLISSLVPVVGCSLTGSESSNPAALFGPLSGLGSDLDAQDLDRLVAPERNTLKVAIATRPIDDPLIDEELWSIADEQVVDSDLRRDLEANGLRIGLIEGDLPPDLEAMLDSEAPYDKRIDPVYISRGDGESALIRVGSGEPPERATIFVSRDGSTSGEDYEAPSGVFDVRAEQSEDRVELKIVPEVHHGPVRRQYAAAEDLGPFEPEQFVFKDGQKEKSFRELAARVKLRPSQALVIGCWPDRRGSLGDFLLTEVDPDTEEPLQSVILIWATASRPNAIPGVAPVTPPQHLRPVDPSEVGLEANGERN